MKSNSKMTWKRGFFEGTYRIFSGDKQVGRLRPSFVNMSARGTIEDTEYIFNTSEIRQQSVVVRKDTKEEVARILYNPWVPKATIVYNGKKYRWSFSSIWETKWEISAAEGVSHRFAGWSCKGHVDEAIPDQLLGLTGLFIGNYYWQMSAIYVAVFLPIFISVI